MNEWWQITRKWINVEWDTKTLNERSKRRKKKTPKKEARDERRIKKHDEWTVSQNVNAFVFWTMAKSEENRMTSETN